MGMSRFWLIAFLFVIVTEPALAQAPSYSTPNTGVCWDMDDLAAHAGSAVTGVSPEFMIHGLVTISSQDTLIVSPGENLIFDDIGGGFQLRAMGHLLALGTAGEMITFTCTHQVPGSWFGIFLEQGLLEYCCVEYAVKGVIVDESAAVIHSTIANNETGLFLFKGSPDISGNLIINNDAGIWCDGMMDRDQGGGKMCEPVIEGNQILDNGSYGIGLVYGTIATVKGNLISGNERGIYSGPYDVSVVVENTISENNYGVFCDKDIISFSALNLGNLSNESAQDDGGNHFHGNLEYDMYNATSDTIKAEGNYWGTTDLNVIESHIYDDEEDVSDADGNGVISGPVDFMPLGETWVQHNTWGQIKAKFR